MIDTDRLELIDMGDGIPLSKCEQNLYEVLACQEDGVSYDPQRIYDAYEDMNQLVAEVKQLREKNQVQWRRRMIDTDKYTGHTEGKWIVSCEDGIYWNILTVSGEQLVECRLHNTVTNLELMIDAPLLLAEVKQIHEILREAFTTEAKHDGAEYLNMIARVTGLIE